MTTQSLQVGLPVIVSVSAVLAGAAATLPFVALGPVSMQMTLHIAVMNVAAPVAALLTLRYLTAAGGFLPLALIATVQMAVLWSSHAPPLQRAAAGSAAIELLMLSALALAALLFWRSLLFSAATGRWRAVGALLVTGKLACLLGGLLIFAPRDIYNLPAFISVLCAAGPSTLADQQLAGLIMIVACPLSYVVAGIVFAAQMLADIERPQRVVSET